MDGSSPMHHWFALSEGRYFLHVKCSYCSIKWLRTSNILVAALLLDTQTLNSSSTVDCRYQHVPEIQGAVPSALTGRFSCFVCFFLNSL